jgi:hypothetical protein
LFREDRSNVVVFVHQRESLSRSRVNQLDHVSDDEFAEVVDAMRRDLAALTSVDFIAATGELDA